MSLEKLCVVAGAGPGIGRAVAERFAQGGYAIAVLARRQTAMEEMAEGLLRHDVNVGAYGVDLTRSAEVGAVFDDIRKEMGDPSVLVYNAAGWRDEPAMTMDPAAFAHDLGLSVVGALSCAQEVYPAMKRAGTGGLLFTGGGLALYPQFGAGVSSLAVGKAGLRALVYALAKEIEPSGVHAATVTVAGTVREGTPFAPALIAERFWTLHQQPRAEWKTEIGRVNDCLPYHGCCPRFSPR